MNNNTVFVPYINVKCGECGELTKVDAKDYDDGTFHCDSTYQVECVKCKKEHTVVLPTVGWGKVLRESQLREARSILMEQCETRDPRIERLIELLA